MTDLVVAMAGGKVDGEYVVDLTGDEEKITGCDLPIAYIPRTKEMTLLQMDGDLSKADIKGVLKASIKACEKLQKIQTEALKAKWDVSAEK